MRNLSWDRVRRKSIRRLGLDQDDIVRNRSARSVGMPAFGVLLIDALAFSGQACWPDCRSIDRRPHRNLRRWRSEFPPSDGKRLAQTKSLHKAESWVTFLIDGSPGMTGASRSRRFAQCPEQEVIFFLPKSATNLQRPIRKNKR